MALVYMATNTKNGKRYIGFTARPLAVRRRSHLGNAKREAKGCTLFWNAIRKYGAAAFAWTVLRDGLTVEGAKALEVELIATLRPEYNLSAGGEGTVGVPAWNRKAVICLSDGRIFGSYAAAGEFYKVHFVDVAHACRNEKSVVRGLHFADFVRDMTPGERAKAIQARKLKKTFEWRTSGRSALGRQPARTRDRIGRSMAGPMTNARKVLCVDDGEVYESVVAAAKAYGAAKSAIVELCLGQRGRKTVSGLRFRYLESENGAR